MQSKPNNINRQNSGLASEYYVASLLSRKGYMVNLTLGNTKEVDLVVLNMETDKFATLDVKGLKNRSNWPISKNNSYYLNKENHFFVLVAYNNNFHNIEFVPEVFAVPSLEIGELTESWAGNPQKKCVAYKKVKNNEKYSSFKQLDKALL